MTVGLDTSRSLVWLHIAQVHRMQREKVCGPVLDEQLRTLAGVLQEHLDAVKLVAVERLPVRKGRSMIDSGLVDRVARTMALQQPGWTAQTYEAFPTFWRRCAREVILVAREGGSA